jgi:streptogramin lyase
MNVEIIALRRWAAAVGLLVLSCGIPSRAWCGDNLWVAQVLDGIESYTPADLKKSGSPTPIHLDPSAHAVGIAFDKSHNLWATIGTDEVVEFSAAQLKDLKNDPNPTPVVIITASPGFQDANGCNFDSQGNLWLADSDNQSIDELSKAQLDAGSAVVTPAIVITSSNFDPRFVTFDKAGNLWTDNQNGDSIAEFSVSQLSSSGPKSPAVVLSDDGSGSLSGPGEIAFDKNGNLWVPNGGGVNTVVEFSKDQLGVSGSPVPAVKLDSAAFDSPFSAVFDTKGDLFVMNFTGLIMKFTSKQTKTSGAPVPKISVSGSAPDDFQIIFGPAS